LNKAFTKESDIDNDGDDEIEAPSPLPAGSRTYITPNGYTRLKTELKHLLDRERPDVVKAVSWAASNGDRSENADYIYGKRRLREIDWERVFRDAPPRSEQSVLRKQLDAFRGKLWRTKIAEAVLAGVFGLIFSFLLVFALDRIWQTPALLRLAILIAGTSLAAVFAPWWLHRWVWGHRRENQLARLIAKRFPLPLSLKSTHSVFFVTSCHSTSVPSGMVMSPAFSMISSVLAKYAG
jgi:hypothetical protein